MPITFFFRKPSPSYHSIEKLFSAIIENLPEGLAEKHFSPYQSKGLWKRILIGMDARKFQGNINHITGDIHFIALFLKKNKTILTIHDIGILKQGNFLRRSILKLFWFQIPIWRVKMVTVISEFTKQELAKHLYINQDKVKVVHNCIPNIYRYTPKTKAAQKPIILQIGTKENKNLERLVIALENMDCTLIIVGPLNQNQLNILKKYKTDYENHFNISEQELLALFIKCDLLAYISTYEGFGMPVIEANAVGRPVLASNIEPIKSVSGNAALLVDPYNISEIRNQIEKLLTDRILRDKLIENGRENAKKYSSAEIAKIYLAVYEKMIEI